MRTVPFAIAFVLCQSAWAGDGREPAPRLGTVSEELNTSGGCALQLPSQYAKREGRYIFTSDFEKHAVVNVDGADTRVELVGSKGHDLTRKAQVGERSTYSYSGAGMDVRVDYVVTGTCPGDGDACKITHYDATLTVKRGKASKTVAVKAVCGS